MIMLNNRVGSSNGQNIGTNTHFHISMSTTPFYSVYNRPPLGLLPYQANTIQIDDVDKLLQNVTLYYVNSMDTLFILNNRSIIRIWGSPSSLTILYEIFHEVAI